MKRKLVLYIILSIIAVIIMVFALININSYTKNTNSGTITIELIDSDNVKSTKDLPFTKNDSLYSLLDSNYEIEVKNGMLIKIDNLYTPDTTDKFIKILINDSMSNYGIYQIKLVDKDVITFIITDVKSYA